MWSASMPLLPESPRLRLTICGVVARDFVIRPEANWIKFSSCLATSPFKLRSATSAANKELRLRSMIAWESSHWTKETVCSAYELPPTRRLSGNTTPVIAAYRRTIPMERLAVGVRSLWKGSQ